MVNIVYALLCIAVLMSQVAANLFKNGEYGNDGIFVKNLPTSDCDSIVISSSYAFEGKLVSKCVTFNEQFLAL